MAGLPGWLYYVDPESLRVLRLTPTGLVPILDKAGSTATVAPDGHAIAYVDNNANLILTDRDGKHPRTLPTPAVGAGYEPAWSPDSTRILTARPVTNGGATPGIIDTRTATFTPLAHNPNGIHYLWSADGKHLGYATGTCQIGTANSDGSGAHLTPTLGDTNPTTNPTFKRSCDPYSISPDGTRIAVDLHTGNLPDGDIAHNLTANTVIDTRTGNTIPLPVTGTITAIYFQPDASMLIRHTTGTTTHLTLIKPNGTTTDATEPTTTTNLRLLTYTPN